MEDPSSAYQTFKILLAQYLPVDRDILHVVIGLVLKSVAVLMTRKSLRWAPFAGALLIACLLGAGMELLDRRDDLQTLNVWRWRASLADFLRTTSIPFVGLLIAVYLRRTRRR